MHSFLGKINFVRRFIFDFAEIVNPLKEMIKKAENYKLTKERKEAFVKIKESIVEASTLWSLDFVNHFILYTFSSNHLIMVILTQKDEVGDDFSISFMNTGLKGV